MPTATGSPSRSETPRVSNIDRHQIADIIYDATDGINITYFGALAIADKILAAGRLLK